MPPYHIYIYITTAIIFVSVTKITATSLKINYSLNVWFQSKHVIVTVIAATAAAVVVIIKMPKTNHKF
jgi:hypothetical protein